MIYYIEDDANIRELVVYTLNQTGLSARGFSDSAAFFTAMQEEKPSLVLLDIMLPGEDGLTILKKIRSASSTASLPVMMITAKSAEYDKVTGLDLGADYYLTKPFGVMELVSCVKAVLRRNRRTPPPVSLHPLVIDEASWSASYHGISLDLTPVEFRLLRTLAHAPGRVFSREQLLDGLYDDHRVVTDRTVDSHIKNLRRKLEQIAPEPALIRSIYGVGYRFEG